MLQEITTTITDRNGDEHKYKLDPHPAAEGFDLQATLVGILGEGFGQALAGDAEDLGSFGTGIAVLMARLLAHGGHKLCFQLLKYTYRENPDGGWEKVSNNIVFDRVYQRNYVELYKVMWWVLDENFGELWKGDLPFLGEGGLSGLMQQLRQQSGTSSTPPD